MCAANAVELDNKCQDPGHPLDVAGQVVRGGSETVKDRPQAETKDVVCATARLPEGRSRVPVNVLRWDAGGSGRAGRDCWGGPGPAGVVHPERARAVAARGP